MAEVYSAAALSESGEAAATAEVCFGRGGRAETLAVPGESVSGPFMLLPSRP